MINPYISVWDMGLGTWDMIFQLKKPFILSLIPFPLSQRELISVYYIKYMEYAKLIAFVIAPQNFFEEIWVNRLSSCFGNLEHKGKFFPFNKTDYYKPEMGENLHRCVISFEGLIEPENIGTYKNKAIELENGLRNENGGRILNIDVGYMDFDKIVLPSTKRGPFKLYAGSGIWLDMVLTYSKGDFSPTQWAFADFKDNPYKRDLILIREKYKRG